MKRRDFVSLASAAMGTSLLYSCRKDLIDTEAASHLDIMAARGGGGTVAARYPLKIPSAVSPSGLFLESTKATSDLGGGLVSNVWAYKSQYENINEYFPGPTIVANNGDNVTVKLTNRLDEQTITHWHGLIVDYPNDGNPRLAINKDGIYDYNFTINQRASLNFYHPHPHMLTGKQVYMGQTGAFIIRDVVEEAGLPTGNYEVPLILRDATLDKSGNLTYKPASGGMFGKIPLVNGTSPKLNVERAVYRFRIVNGANSRIFGLALSNNANMRLIGNDGGLLTASVDLNRIDIANGERIDILFDFRTVPTNVSTLMLRDLRAGWDLLEFNISNTVMNSAMPVTSSSIAPLDPNPSTTREFSFDAMSKINGKEYDMDRIDWTVPFGVTERWRFKTNGNAPHPVHVHGAHFQVQSRSGGRGVVFPWEAGWKDTVLLEDGETVEVLIRFENFRGLYLLHCHKLEHEDMGMMANFEVV